MDNIIEFAYYQTLRDNNELEIFIQSAIADGKFANINMNLIRECINDWYNTDSELKDWHNNENQNSIRSTSGV